MVRSVREECEVVAPDGAPSGVLDAFWRYEDALLGEDRATLDELTAAGPHTLDGDGVRLLVGHEAVARSRSARAPVPAGGVHRLHVQVITDDAVLVMALTGDADAIGLRTQLWRRADGRWTVSAAHTSPPADRRERSGRSPLDTTVWRSVGNPLVNARASGPLDGVGVAVKDLYAVAGHPVGAGVPAWLAEQPPEPESAPAVTALLDAGAHLVGIAGTNEFAYSLTGVNAHYGTPPNPAAPGRVSGGSSSGSASAVALGQAAVGLGTDTAGSIRVPASYQGLVGLRTTHGRVPVDRVLPLARSFDSVGWLTRDVAGSAAVAAVLLAGPEREPPAATRTVRLPTVEAWAGADVRDALRGAVAEHTAAGALPPAREAELPPERLESWFAAFRTVQAWEAWQAHGQWISAHPGALGADVAARFDQAREVTGEQVARARETAAEARDTLRAMLADAVLVIPSAPGPAPERDATPERVEAERAATVRMTCLAGLAGAPAISLPLLRSADGLPVGLCLVGAPGGDRALLALAARLVDQDAGGCRARSSA